MFADQPNGSPLERLDAFVPSTAEELPLGAGAFDGKSARWLEALA